ncbi:TPA: hypothetical protein JI034_10365 [Acinetobacter baumannii]|uniref:Uncharacterized protein n=3 Tax=Acinetobacter calcoaceticus/baumannii complex TaxID=909768 RepID=A0AB33BS62_ACIPI|nr:MULTISPECIES: hypothetical protein [Acinetobacter calcoaceticus/baumannii complex]CAP01801.1 conserved hypothetical protein [Acinetobacter baumannii SDF]AMX20369.1 hypothetical protein IEC338SC_3258 [Acinetobacter pittii]EKW5259559.1 hypothetical protein [Acinetobacter baumannii]ENW11447.1 hypothetical protein F930_01394 [Acinetobacter pittii ANC 3678]MCT9459231.1 hypothetical protein [Acinetobacter baumannii]
MLVEKFDFIELLRLAIAQSEGKGKITKHVVLGEIALLPAGAKKWAELLLERVDFERIAEITETKKIYETRIINGKESKKRIGEIPGKVEIKKGEINSADFFRVRNVLAGKIHREMIKKNFKPNNCQGDLSNVAKGIAEVVLRGRLFTKAMCGHCQGLGKLELFNEKGYPNGSKFCDKCGGTGKRPYTLHEKITIAKLKVSKSGYSERYEPYELIAEACIENWENSIRTSLARSFHFEPEEITLA